ncbi:NPCBM/NEW2 domain-containing protein [Streptomyces sp. NPDC014864]|uniref:NPCBM/NEW2 domain-containing protein n=1 Tax=Streptomyces sp. NPDC014864 TaxID=3364924 RepID=UPI0036F5461A
MAFPVRVKFGTALRRFPTDENGTAPEMRFAGSSWVWRRYGLSVDGERYARGVTVHGASSVTVDLDRACSAHDTRVGVDDRTAGLGRVSFAVYADGVRLWSPGVLAAEPRPSRST